MLPAAHRLRRSVDFERAVRRGVRAGRSTVVVHLSEDSEGAAQPQVGFVVSKAVGNAVHRNLVKRRLRAATAARLEVLPARARAVVRALPASADATFDQLSTDVTRGLERAAQRLHERTGAGR
ncbi:ribonuclease P protein component [Cellulosimicrobium sp. BIT-GX5]|uniref:Ribonuclease P protein component n=1 Tax=Cellulosimicrobium composti TaxID=2672572 RepID=A0A6N7ZG79_9MICO|nr:ribonuclease P protein component [Cellulosimicrobium composti]MTG88338.1 ribonuclease P protein component [Cellulosimicrobium composti]